MGQYYHPININTMEWLSSHDYNNGLKLMEHSYIGNEFVGAIMHLLSEGQPWHKARIVWAGDYAKRKRKDFFPDATEAEQVVEELNDSDGNLYGQITNEGHIKPESMPEKEQVNSILVNHTRREYVDLRRVMKESDGETTYIVNPLPLLTADGNGLGGGDYNGTHMEDVGRWAGDAISVETTVPEKYSEFKTRFVERG